MNKSYKKIAITTGDVNGIGAEITIKALNSLDLPKEDVVIISNSDVLNYYGKLKIDYEILQIPCSKDSINPGIISDSSGEFSFQSLVEACNLAKSKKIGAIVTAPVSKFALHQAGHIFNGQTEILQEFLGSKDKKAEMLFVANDFRVLLLTRHVALKEVSLDFDILYNKILNLHKFFQEKFGISNPRFALCGFNPHAGEDGILGSEEIEILIPLAQKLNEVGIDITKPLPSDTLFIQAGKKYLSKTEMPYDCYLANYHDQGLIPIKTLASDKTVNMTIGLDVIRTSPSHGTAYDIAGKNKASFDSMRESILEALKFV